MKKLLLLIYLGCLFSFVAFGQEQSLSPGKSQISRDKLTLRPNSRDYTIVRKGNNHQRIMQMRSQALLRNKQAVMNRQMSMDRRRAILQQRMIRQQQIKQRMIRQRGMHR